jgi:hypothetical protein
MPNAIYQPDDSQITLAGLEFLRTPDGGRLRQAVATLPSGGAAPTVAQIALLRKEFPAEPVHTALALGRLQAKAAGPHGKFPHLGYVWATPEALEQATHLTVGRYKAERFAALGATHLFDLCAGIGGDTLAFLERFPVTAVEMSPVRAACLRFNAQESVPPLQHSLEVRQEDVGAHAAQWPADAWVHIDPARRSAGKRSTRYEDLIPGPGVLEQLFAGNRRGAVKLSPAVDFASLPPISGSDSGKNTGHVELISHLGTVVQALWWLGTPQSPQARTATVLGSSGERWSLTAPPRPAEPADVQAGPIAGARLYELDGAITRAGLAQVLAESLGLTPLTVDGGYLLGKRDLPPPSQTPWRGALHAAIAAFDVQTIVPMGRIPEALAQLPASPPGAVEVKSRGHLPGLDCDDLQRKWSRLHGRLCTVLLFRQRGETLAAVGFRAKDASATMQ